METKFDRNPEMLIEERVDPSKSAVLAFQHVLIMNAYVVPVIIATILGYTPVETSRIIQSTFLASGIATLLQAVVFMKYPVIYGASFVPASAIVGIYMLNGGTASSWEYVVGACLIGSIAMLLLGLSNSFNKILNNLITPTVSATIVLCIGVSLIPLAFSSQIFVENGMSVGQNILIATVTIITMILFTIIGSGVGKLATVARTGSGIFALIAGFIVANLISKVDMTAVQEASLITRPALPFVDFGIKFDASSVLTMVVIYFVLMTETTGTWLATSSTTGAELTDTRVNKGVVGLGVSNILSALLGSTPMSGYSSNIGILALTQTFSRHVMKLAGILLIIIGFSGKLSTLISVIPSASIGGVFLITSGIIAVAGMRMMNGINFSSKDTYIILLSVIVAIGLNIIPAGVLDSLPVIIQYILGSSIASSALLAIILNKVLPEF